MMKWSNCYLLNTWATDQHHQHTVAGHKPAGQSHTYTSPQKRHTQTCVSGIARGAYHYHHQIHALATVINYNFCLVLTPPHSGQSDQIWGEGGVRRAGKARADLHHLAARSQFCEKKSGRSLFLLSRPYRYAFSKVSCLQSQVVQREDQEEVEIQGDLSCRLPKGTIICGYHVLHAASLCLAHSLFVRTWL